jgi:hypothetical protein
VAAVAGNDGEPTEAPRGKAAAVAGKGAGPQLFPHERDDENELGTESRSCASGFCFFTMKANDDSWKAFEHLVERLHRGFHQNAIITPNDKIIGRDTGRSRQIDISIRYKLGPTDVLIIVECKKWRRAVDAPEMDSFIGLKKDVGAHVGIIVCENRFSKAATRLAKQNNIELFTVADTQKPNWQVNAKVRVFVEEWTLSPLLMRGIDPDGKHTDFPDDRCFTLLDPEGKEDTAAGVVRKIWDEHPKREPGDYFYEMASGTTPDCNGKFVMGFRADVRRYSRGAKLGLLGLKNLTNGLTYTDSLKIETTSEPIVEQKCAGMPKLEVGEAFGVWMQSTEVKTVERAIPDLDLTKNHIEFTLKFGPKPFSLALRQA